MNRTLQQVFGIRELHRPKEEAAIDIVAVHGLNGDAINTWTTDDQKICWLSDQDLLPKYINRARILTWGYNANVTNLTGKSTSSDRILQHAHTLVAELQSDRELEGATDRPIIFLCHSLGGIIVKRALVYSASRTAPNIAHLHSIYICTFGILFFGTPHNGSNKARLLGSLRKLASISIPRKVLQTESSLVRALEEESETLQNITDQFSPLMHKFRVYFFWEQERTDLKYTKDYIVDEASAAPILDNTERSGIAADHRGMCKFKNSGCQGFRTVVAALRRYNLEAPQIIRARIAKASAILADQRWQEAAELLGGVQKVSSRISQPVPAGRIQNGISRAPGLSGHSGVSSDFETERIPATWEMG